MNCLVGKYFWNAPRDIRMTSRTGFLKSIEGDYACIVHNTALKSTNVDVMIMVKVETLLGYMFCESETLTLLLEDAFLSDQEKHKRAVEDGV